LTVLLARAGASLFVFDELLEGAIEHGQHEQDYVGSEVFVEFNVTSNLS
jgi:hypothetical protein